MKRQAGFTKQGVRDLNSLPSRPSGVRLPPAPRQVGCHHPVARRHVMLNGAERCGVCTMIVYDPEEERRKFERSFDDWLDYGGYD